METDEIFSDLDDEVQDADITTSSDEIDAYLRCDGCGVNCFKESYFVDDSEEDYCCSCYKSRDLKGYYRRNNVNFQLIPDEFYAKEALDALIAQLEKEQAYPNIFESARIGNIDAVQYYVERCQHDVNVVDCGGTPLLHIACMLRQSETIKYLIQKGADINQKDRLGLKAFDYVLNNKFRGELEKFVWDCSSEGQLKFKSDNIEPDTAPVPSHIWHVYTI